MAPIPRARLVAIIVALVLIGSAVVYRLSRPESVIEEYVSSTKPVLGKLGSTHEHAAFIININDKIVDLSGDEFMERDQFAHMHDNVGTVIHKHADGVTLVYFLNTIGITLTRDCLTIGVNKMCTGDSGTLNVLINRKKYTGNLDYYEIHDGDKILIDYSKSSDMELILKANAIPDLPDNLEQNG